VEERGDGSSGIDSVMSGTMRDCEDDEDEAEWLDERRESKDMRDAPLLMIELSESERTCSGSRKRDMAKAGEVGDEGASSTAERVYTFCASPLPRVIEHRK
jgi:hypothetical protein